MSAPLIVVTGTGTGIGKTYLAVALVRIWGARGKRIVGYKPIESGVTDLKATDAFALEEASTFHVKHLPAVRLRAPISPHLAAEAENATVDLGAISSAIAEARRGCDGMVVELPGGLFSPVTRDVLGIAFAQRLDPTALVLVAPDRLGVIHDAIAAVRAARAFGTAPTHVLLNAPIDRDASSGTNAREIAHYTKLPVLGPVARNEAAPNALAALLDSLAR